MFALLQVREEKMGNISAMNTQKEKDAVVLPLHGGGMDRHIEKKRFPVKPWTAVLAVGAILLAARSLLAVRGIITLPRFWHGGRFS